MRLDAILKSKKAFTLAEVLIALVIIGVVAAITVPIIFANSNEQALKAALKKNHAVLEQAVRRYQVENGIPMNKEVLASNSDLTNNFFLKYFNVSCSGLDCKTDKEITYKVYDRKTKTQVMKFPYWLSVMLTDGTYIHYGIYSAKNVATFLVDVNGPFKKPNVQGEDTFLFEITEDGILIPSGGSKSSYKESSYCTRTSSYDTSGYGCTAKVLRSQ